MLRRGQCWVAEVIIQSTPLVRASISGDSNLSWETMLRIHLSVEKFHRVLLRGVVVSSLVVKLEVMRTK